MPITRSRALVIALSVLALSLSLAPAGVTAAPTMPPKGTATPLRAVVALIAPFSNPAAGHNACNALTGRVATCPITPRLLYRLEHPIRFKENGNLICRCQNPPRAVRWMQTDNNGFLAHVNVHWMYLATNSYTVTFVVAHQDDGWRVDDAYCAGDPTTSIYEPPTGPCASGSGASMGTSMPHLSFPCRVPVNAVVTCPLAGRGFYAHERVSITYRIEVSTTHGKKVTVIHRAGMTDGQGAFTRPVLRFQVDPRVLIYKVTAVVTGARGDRAEITDMGTP
jgi:hypothetical protein